MRRCVLLMACLSLAGCEAFTSDVNVVARAGEYELSVTRLAQIMAEGKTMPLRSEVVRRVVSVWVDYAIFAQHIAGGADLLDSAMVMTGMWRDIQQLLADKYHDQLMAPYYNLSRAQVDSLYRTGEYRLVKHILVRVAPDAAPPERESKRSIAEGIRQRLVEGGSWETENEQYNDDRSRSDGGSLGVIAAGETVAVFDSIAFALEPGAISDVVESAFGFHVISRPVLDDVYDEFKFDIEDRLVLLADTAYLDNLPARREIEVRTNAPVRAREAIQDLSRSTNSRRVLATYDSGEFTVSDFKRWYQGFPPDAQAQVAVLPADSMRIFITELATNHVLIQEALDAGVEISSADFQSLRDAHERGIEVVRATMNITVESLGDSAQTREARFRQLELRVDQYMDALAKNERRFVALPPYLADTLRSVIEWGIEPAGIERVVQEAIRLRAALDEIAAPVQPVFPPRVPDAAASTDSTG